MLQQQLPKMSNLVSIPVAVLGICIAIWLMKSPSHLPNVQEAINSSYDYIIVGAGSSGSVLASRLSENPETSVLLLEAGGYVEDNPNIDVPALAILLMDSKQDWSYYTEPQPNACKTFNDQRSFWSRGRVLGGSGSMNFLVYIRGSRHDYNSWAKEGCDGWSYKDVLPYFLKSEDIQIPELMDSPYHYKGGGLSVTDVKTTPLQDVYLQAGQDLGYNISDCNGFSQIGFSRSQATIRNGRRWSSYKAYLEPVMSRKNLHVSINSLVTKVLIENRQAKGVTFIKNAVKHTVYAVKEVILSAGAINSPQILMLSGIGPKQHLNDMGISVIADLPVGQNLQDHYSTILNYYINTTDTLTADKLTSTLTGMKYKLFKTGYLADIPAEAAAFVYKDERTDDTGNAPDIHINFLSLVLYTRMQRDAGKFNIMEKFKDKIFTQNNEQESLIMWPSILHPKSRGTIKLKSADPFDAPLINPNYLEEPSDIDTLLKAIQICEKLSDTPSMRKIGVSSENDSPLFSVCKEHKHKSIDYWKCYIRHFTFPFFHSTSTCRMGAVNDPTAVVDPQLRVKNIQGLRVVDASVMRNVPSGNTNAPCIMIGEKAADIIKETNSVKDIIKNLKSHQDTKHLYT